MRDEVLRRATEYYLTSGDFNGLPARTLGCEFPEGPLADAVEALVREQLVSLNFGDRHPNPYIKALPPSSPDEQGGIMRAQGLANACIYPEGAHLRAVVDQSRYAGRPYTLEMALGGAQLEHRAFELTVLERYRNDPRYRYENDDISGQVGIRAEFYGPEGVPERDQISMQTFGFCFDDDMNCYVAAFLRYLHDLSPEHQQHWRGYEVTAGTRLHPDYFRPALLGEFPERVSVYTAITLEMQAINDLAAAIGREPLLRQDFREAPVPPHFGRLVRPTAHEFDQFILALDRMLSDNLNIDFFGTDVPRERESQRADGRVVVQPKGSIQILSDWLEARFRPADQESRDTIAEMLKTLREVRKARQRPAHALDDNTFDQTLTRKQRELIVRVYRAVKAIRLLLANDKGARAIAIEDAIREGRIWSM